MSHSKQIRTDVVVEATVDVPTVNVEIPKEIQKIEEREAQAMNQYNQKAQKALGMILENHFHLRLYKAVGGKS